MKLKANALDIVNESIMFNKKKTGKQRDKRAGENLKKAMNFATNSKKHGNLI